MAWTTGSLLLVAFNFLEWLVGMGGRLIRFPLGRRSRWVSYAFLVFTLFLALMIPVGDRRTDTVAVEATLEHGYGLVSWEIENFFDKWTHRVWTVLPWTPTAESDRRSALDRYVVLVDELNSAKAHLNTVTSTSNGDRKPADVRDAQDAVDRLIAERDGLRDSVEEFLEQAIGDVVRADTVDLVAGFVWPPIDFRIDSPPKLLVTSPRNEIRREEDVLLDPGTSVDEMSRIENELAADHDLSAVVLQIGGLAAYPNILPTVGLKRLLEVASHEWLHAYLAFHPLGRAYFGGGEIRSINETLGDMFGREAGLLAYSEITGEPYVAPIRPETASKDVDVQEEAEDPDAFTFSRFMGETRRHTDELLGDGLIVEAEEYMEERRVELLDHGYKVRKINQAYFAFHGTYAESPASTSPLARYLWDLREQVDTIGDLVKLLRPVSTYQEFEDLLVERGVELEVRE